MVRHFRLEVRDKLQKLLNHSSLEKKKGEFGSGEEQRREERIEEEETKQYSHMTIATENKVPLTQSSVVCIAAVLTLSSSSVLQQGHLPTRVNMRTVSEMYI